MKDLWHALEEQTAAWHALERQRLADAIWEDFVSVRFGRTGDPRALGYLYPYLNHAQRTTRLRALEVAGRVFEGRGPRALDGLDYFTKNGDPFIRDRAVCVVGAALTGCRDDVILDALGPYLGHRNLFIRKGALEALGKAAAGSNSEKVLAEIRRVAATPGMNPEDVEWAVARAFSGRPNDAAYALVAKPELSGVLDTFNEETVAVLVRAASDAWYQRACQDCFEPRLHAGDETGWCRQFLKRDGVVGLCHAAAGRGMEALRRTLHLRHERCPANAILQDGPTVFEGADCEANRPPLLEMARSGDIQEQRIASVCLGRLVMGAEDDEAIGLLRDLCTAKNRSVRAAAVTGLGMAARSSCDAELREVCLGLTVEDETGTPAIGALGMIFLGSGRTEVFDDLRRLAEGFRARPVRSKRHCGPLARCYLSVGRVFLGTGSMEPLPHLLDVLASPRVAHARDEYHWCAARALMMVEFSESALGWPYIALR